MLSTLVFCSTLEVADAAADPLLQPPACRRRACIARARTSAAARLVGDFTDRFVLTAEGWRCAEPRGTLDFPP